MTTHNDHRAYIGLGSNLDQPQQQIRRAIADLNRHPKITVLNCSSLYSGQPLGPADQPDYVNAAMEIRCQLTPIALLDCLQNQEQQQRRQKLRHWGERTIDLDILLIDDLIIRESRLLVPHPEMTKRRFVLKPLMEIAPDLTMPDGRPLASITPDFDGLLHQIGKVSLEPSKLLED